jgi:hypothetical protein
MRNISQENGIIAPIIPAIKADLVWMPFRNSIVVFI